jgi:hypothetical protein
MLEGCPYGWPTVGSRFSGIFIVMAKDNGLKFGHKLSIGQIQVRFAPQRIVMRDLL